MQTATPMAADKSEISLAKHMAFGALCGMVGWAVVTLLVVRLGWPEESWGFALVASGFAGLWVGPFFGSAGGIATHQLRADAAEHAEHAPASAGGATFAHAA
jgi:hypothetical protein